MKYDFSSVQVNLPKDLSKKIISWGKKHISDKILYHEPNNPGFGRENEIHITILYGIHSKVSNETRMILKKVKPFTIKLGKISVFDKNDQFDVVKIEVHSDKLHELNKSFRKKLNYTNKYPIYHPHVTIAYVKPGEGKRFTGKTPFKEETFTTDYVIFSSREGVKEKIKLNESIDCFSKYVESFQFL